MDHFKNFKGFGTEGTYLYHSRDEPLRTTLDFLEQHRGKGVKVEYNHATFPKEGYELGWVPIKRLDYREGRFVFVDRWMDPSEQEGSLEPVFDSFKVPSQGSLDRLLNRFNTDNIKITIDAMIYEIQRMRIGDQSISEVRVHEII